MRRWEQPTPSGATNAAASPGTRGARREIPKENSKRSRDSAVSLGMGVTVGSDVEADMYQTFVAEHRERLLQVFVARFGTDVGREATSDVMAYAFEHWSQVSAMAHPLGYLYGVGQSSARKQFRWFRSQLSPHSPTPHPPLYREPSHQSQPSRRGPRSVARREGLHGGDRTRPIPPENQLPRGGHSRPGL
jgi:hypothetical protein